MDVNFLVGHPLFRDLTAVEISSALACLGAYEKKFGREELLCRAGEPLPALGLVLEGRVRVETADAWGDRSLLDSLGPGQVFGETYACLPGEPMMVSVAAETGCRVLFLNGSKLLTTCPTACGHHSRLIRNLLTISARKNLNLTHQIFHTAHRTIRGKVLSYLSFQAVKEGCREFAIPFDRQQLADYLGVDRSALSAELGKLRREGLLDFHKNHFRLAEE